MTADSSVQAQSEPNAAMGTAAPSARRRAVFWFVLAVLGVVVGGSGTWAAHRWLNAPDSESAVGQMLYQQEWEPAERLARRHLRRRPNDPEAIMLLSRALGGRKAFGECAELLETVPPGSPQRADALLRAGQSWMMTARLDAAERAWRDCLELQSTDVGLPAVQQECRHQLGHMYALERRTDAFRAMTWEMYENAAPQMTHEALALRVRYRFVIATPAVALGQLEKALEQDPQDVFARRAVGFYQLELGKAEAARAMLYRCVQEAENEPLNWEIWLECLYRTGDPFGLEQAIGKLPPAADASALCWKFRAIVADHKSNPAGAITAIERAITLDPFEAELHHLAAQYLVRADRNEDAQSHVVRNRDLQEASESLRGAMEDYDQRWSRQPSRRPELAYALGQACERLGQTQDALGWYRAGLSQNPAHAELIAALERLHAQSPSREPDRHAVP
jgi:tetratricopeptide (TPR) repeat protein